MIRRAQWVVQARLCDFSIDDLTENTLYPKVCIWVNGAFVPGVLILKGFILCALIPRIIRPRGIDPTEH